MNKLRYNKYFFKSGIHLNAIWNAFEWKTCKIYGLVPTWQHAACTVPPGQQDLSVPLASGMETLCQGS